MAESPSIRSPGLLQHTRQRAKAVPSSPDSPGPQMAVQADREVSAEPHQEESKEVEQAGVLRRQGRRGPGRRHRLPRRAVPGSTGVGRNGRTPSSSTTTGSSRAVTSPRGSSRRPSRRRFGRHSGRCDDHNRDHRGPHPGRHWA
jgi:hypothetical protein